MFIARMSTFYGGFKMKKETHKGHEVYVKDDTWYYSSDDKPVSENWKSRGCGLCNKLDIIDGHESYDACLGRLPGVMNACCGHGDSSAYIQLPGGKVLSNAKSIKFIDNILGKENWGKK